MDTIKKLIQKDFSKVDPGASVNSIKKLFLDQSFVVVSGYEQYCGIVTSNEFIQSNSKLIKDYIIDKPKLAYDQNIDTVYQLMRETKQDVLAVFQSEQFIGVITLETIADYFFQHR